MDFDAIFTTRTVREFDTLAIVPQFGFKNVDDYYTQVSLLAAALVTIHGSAMRAYCILI